MKSLFFIALIVIAFSLKADPSECLKQHCPTEYNACKNEVFGCAVAGVRCQNKCGSDAVCQYDCAVESGNAKLITLATCGKEFCKDTATECQIDKCSKIFSKLCLSGEGFHVETCVAQFFTENPDCECVKNQ